MADGGSGMKQFTGEMGQVAAEVAKDVKDEVGQMIEQGVQSVVGKQLTPQQVQQKQQDEQKQLAEARRKIKWYQDLTAAQKRVHEQEKQKQQQNQQAEQQQAENKKVEEAQRKQPIPQPGKLRPVRIREDIARTRQEIGKGRGVGG